MMCSTAVRTFNAALEAVLPSAMIHKHLTRHGDTVYAGEFSSFVHPSELLMTNFQFHVIVDLL